MLDTNPQPNRSFLDLQIAAEKGDIEALCQLGMMYEHGLNTAKDPAAALLCYKQASDLGSGHAQFKMALIYENGLGVDQDLEQAAACYRKAAELGLPEAQYKLGQMLENGRGVSPKYAEAASWYLQAANQGLPDAFFRLGLIYEHGLGMAPDPQTAAHYYQEASNRGSSSAHYNLANLYLTGQGVAVDKEEAARLLELAANQGITKAGQKLNILLAELAQSKSRPPITRTAAKPRTEETLASAVWSMVKKILLPASPAAIAGILLRCTPVGSYIGQICKDHHTALAVCGGFFALIALALLMSFFRLQVRVHRVQWVIASLSLATAVACAAILLNPDNKLPTEEEQKRVTISIPASSIAETKSASSVKYSTTITSQRQNTGTVQKNSIIKPAARVSSIKEELINARLLTAATRGDATAQYQLALRYETGKGVSQDDRLAIKWLEDAAAHKQPQAQCRMGTLYKNGRLVKADYLKSQKLLGEAAAQKETAAIYQLGLMQEFGEGTKQNNQAAAKLYAKATLAGDPYAAYRLALMYRDGRGVPSDKKKAVSLLVKALQHNIYAAAQTLHEDMNSGALPKDEAVLASSDTKLSEGKSAPEPGSSAWLHETVEKTANRTAANSVAAVESGKNGGTGKSAVAGEPQSPTDNRNKAAVPVTSNQ